MKISLEKTPLIPSQPELSHNPNQKTPVSMISRIFRTKIGKLSLGLLATAGGLSTYNHFYRLGTIEEVSQPDGTIEYFHSDAQTTHILNYLSGKEPLNEDDERASWVEVFEDITVILGKTTPSTENMSVEQIKAAIKELDPTYFEKQNANEYHVKKRDLNPLYYKYLWQSFQKFGRPKIRWGSAKFNYNFTEKAEARDCYNATDNTLHIDPELQSFTNTKSSFNDGAVFAELAHAKQLNDDPFKSLGKFALATCRVTRDTLNNGKPWSVNQKEEYARPGSLEYEAHSIIEKELVKGAKKTFSLGD